MQKLTFDNQTFEIPDLEQGSHLPDAGKYCAMEMVAYLAGEEHSDHPECVCPVIAEFVRRCNDRMSSKNRNRFLNPLLLDMIGTRSTKEIEKKRAFMCADWAVRTLTPFALSLSGQDGAAQYLNKLNEIVDMKSANAARAAVDKVAFDIYGASDVFIAVAARASYIDRVISTAASVVLRTTFYYNPSEVAFLTTDIASEAANLANDKVKSENSSAYYTAADTASVAAAKHDINAAAVSILATATDPVWDLASGLIRQLIAAGEREPLDMTALTERAQKLT